MKYIQYSFLLCCIGLAGVGAYLMIADVDHQVPKQNPFIIDDTKGDLGNVEIGKHEIIYAILNANSHPRRFLGSGAASGLNCRVLADQHKRATIQPGETFPYTVSVYVFGPGEFSATITVFLEENGIRKVELPINGVASVPESSQTKDEAIQK